MRNIYSTEDIIKILDSTIESLKSEYFCISDKDTDLESLSVLKKINSKIEVVSTLKNKFISEAE